MSAAQQIDLRPKTSEAIEFLSDLDQIHLVSIRPDAPENDLPRGKDFQQDWQAAVEWAEVENADGRNVYWTVNLVRPHKHGKPKKGDIRAARFAHLDIDPPKDGASWSKRETIKDLEALPKPPSFILDSGNGVQAFWRLEEQVENREPIEAINTGLRDRFKADNCQNIDRLMRVPGFVNWPDALKRGRGLQPCLASIACADDGVVYSVEELAAAFPVIAKPPRPATESRKRVKLDGNPPLLTPDDLGLGKQNKIRLSIEQPEADRSRAGQRCARLMHNAGYAEEQIAGILLNWENAVSAHYLDQADPLRAVERTISLLRQPQEKHGLKLDHFRAYMPAHSYIFAPTGELWPGTSVNSRLAPIPLLNRNGQPILDKKGEPVEQRASAWLDENRAVEQMTWAPGLPQVIEDKLVSDGGWRTEPGFNVFNLYRPPLPIEGDPEAAGPWIEHVHRVYPDDAAHMIRWFAHRVQKPEEKINHAIVMGGAQGIGKDTILEGVKSAIGPWNFAEVSPQHLLGRFNGFVKSVILRISEARDLGDVDRFAFYDHLKAYAAAPPDVLRVDEKHLREYAAFNVCGVIITTNHKTDGIYLPADDRRHYVAWSNLNRESFSETYWSDLYGWYERGGIGHVAAYLRDLDLSDFNPKAPPPKTPAFWDIVSANSTPEDAELADALDMLGWPAATTLHTIASVAGEDFRNFLTDRRNNRTIPHRLEGCGYVPVRNAAANDGLFKVNRKRCRVYARNTLSIHDQIAAANELIRR